MQTIQHILIIEDDTSLAQWIREYLMNHNYRVTVMHSGGDAVDFIRRVKPNLIVLDIELPEKNGFDICKEARAFYCCPILMVTASSDEMDEVLSLELGADDYLSKPLRPRAMLARIQALLRRPVVDGINQTLQIENLYLDNGIKTIHYNHKPVTITAKEFEVLWLLAKNQSKVVSRTHLVSQLRGLDYDGFDRSIDIRISRLRKKLSEANVPVQITTIWGQGYLFSLG